MKFYDFDQIRSSADCRLFVTEVLGYDINREGRCQARWRGGENDSTKKTALTWRDTRLPLATSLKVKKRGPQASPEAVFLCLDAKLFWWDRSQNRIPFRRKYAARLLFTPRVIPASLYREATSHSKVKRKMPKTALVLELHAREHAAVLTAAAELRIKPEELLWDALNTWMGSATREGGQIHDEGLAIGALYSTRKRFDQSELPEWVVIES